MAETAKETRERIADDWADKRLFERQLREIYEYFMPYRDPATLFGLENQTQGQNRTDRIFDITGVISAFDFAGNMQTEVTPIFQEFFSLEAGPLWPDGDQKNKYTETVQAVGRMVTGCLSSGSFAMKAHEMFLDLFAGTGALYMGKGDENDPFKFRSVCPVELAFSRGPYDEIWGVDHKRQFRPRHLKSLWPKGDFSPELRRKIEEGDKGLVTIHQSMMYDDKEKRHCLRVFAENEPEEAVIHEEDFRVTPWITPRFFVVPGEVYGRGLGHLGLPSVKTTNKVRELALLAAAFAVLGLWTQRNDGVFNPDMIKFEPLAMWQVGSTGGPLGPTIARLETPKDFDVSWHVMQDEREQLKLALMDEGLPPDAGAVRSATEIAERMKRLSQKKGGVMGRLTLEIVAPIVERGVDILHQMGKLPSHLTIDQMLTRVRIIAPIAAGQQASKVSNIVNWLQMMSMLAGPQAALMAAKIEDLFPEMGRMLGVEERFIRSDQDRSQLMQMIGKLQGASQAAAMQPQPQEAAPQQPGAQFVNGGAH